MSPEAERNFEAEWALLSRRLRLLLSRKRVPSSQHDDLVQETALRLLSMWESVDRQRALWPLTVTIVLNLLRDRGRALTRDDLVAELPELASGHDVETVGIARLELERVRRALDELSPSYRSALMREIGISAASVAPEGAADKMIRMRARRKLKLALENVSGLVALRIRRLGDLIEGMFTLRDGGVAAVSCVFCLVLGVGSTLVAPTALIPKASARPAQAGIERSTVLSERAATDRSRSSPVAAARRDQLFARSLDGDRDAARRTRALHDERSSGGSTDTGQAVPLPTYSDVPVVTPPVVPVPGGDEAPSLPSPGAGDQPANVPMPPPPRIPTPEPVADLAEAASKLL